MKNKLTEDFREIRRSVSDHMATIRRKAAIDHAKMQIMAMPYVRDTEEFNYIKNQLRIIAETSFLAGAEWEREKSIEK